MILYLRSCFKYFFYAAFFSLFINTLQLTFPIYMMAVYVRVLDSFSYPTLYAMTFMALAALTVMGSLEFLRSRLLIRAGIRLDKLLSRPALRQMLQGLSRIDNPSYTQGLRDIQTLRNYLGGSAIFAFFDVPWIFVYLGVVYLVHPILGMTATAGAVIILVLGILQSRLTQKDSQGIENVKAQGSQWLQTSLGSARELQCMGMIDEAAKGYCQIHNKEIAFQERIGKFGHFFGSVSQSFGVFMQVAIFGAGAALVIAGESNPGVIISASIIMGRALAPVNQGISAWKQTAGAKTAYNNLKRLLQSAEFKESLDNQDLSGELEVKGLFLDIGDTRVLDDIDFRLKPGEIMGLVGPNGAGKSCLCRMILGMWQPAKGQVLLDNKDVFHLDKDSLGQFIGYLPQNVELFAGSVGDNIARMGQMDSEKVLEAARNSGAHEAILRFPQGYDTDIGDAGQSLSGGQRQRVGLARALYGNPKLVILDEPNSNLDEAGEKALVATLGRLKKMRATTIMITHKPSLLYSVDKILVLDKGRQVRFGPRDEVFGQMTGEY